MARANTADDEGDAAALRFLDRIPDKVWALIKADYAVFKRQLELLVSVLQERGWLEQDTAAFVERMDDVFSRAVVLVANWDVPLANPMGYVLDNERPQVM